jgi:DUF4097 and DUF4098 domain-containing protein YvlB
MHTRLFTASSLALVLTLAGVPTSAAQTGPAQPAQAEGFARHMEELAARIGRVVDHLGSMGSGSARVQEGRLTEKFSKTVPLGRTGSFELGNISGTITVTGGSADQVQIEAVKRGRTAEALQNARIEVVQAADRVEVQVQYPHDSREGASVDFTVTVPKGAGVTVHSVSGDLKLTGIDGELRAETVSGDVAVTSAGRLAQAKSVSGTVTVQSASNADTLSASSVSGNVSLRTVKARGIEATSVSGELDLVDVTCERVVARSTSGNTVFTGPLAKGGRYEVVSHSGDVTINTGDKTGFELTASTFSGDINSDVPLTLRTGGEATERRMRRQQLRGTFGDGSAVLILRSFSGNIKINRK